MDELFEKILADLVELKQVDLAEDELALVEAVIDDLKDAWEMTVDRRVAERYQNMNYPDILRLRELDVRPVELSVIQERVRQRLIRQGVPLSLETKRKLLH